MSQYLNVKSCMCAIITLETPNLLKDAFDDNPVIEGRQRGTQEMAAVRKWLLTMNCQLLGCEPNI